MRLSRGMAIQAVIEARVFGKRLLTLNADIAVLPASSAKGPPAPVPNAHAGKNGTAGNGLIEAAQTLEAGAAELRSARESFP